MNKVCQLLLPALLLACSSESDLPPGVSSAEPAPAAAVDGFERPAWESLQRVSPDRYQVGTEVLLLCVALTAEDLEERYGEHAVAVSRTVRMEVRADPAALRALQGGVDYPVGATIAKRYPGSDFDKFEGGMIKMSPGYDPERGDWLYYVVDAKGAIEHGLLPSCVDCHGQQPRQVFARWWQTEGPDAEK